MKIILISLLFLVPFGCTSKPVFDQKQVQVDPPQDVTFNLEKRLQKITFASCANQDAPQPLWQNILNEKSDLFLFLGDNVYASHPKQQPISAQYDKLSQISDYATLRKTTPTLAIWDDHDYGLNDAGAENPLKHEAKQEFLRHWPYVQKQLSPTQSGIYHAMTWGPQKQEIQFLFLDTRWERSPLVKAKNPLNPFHKFDPNTDPKSTILGEEQWTWLEQELQKPARLRVLISSIQLIPAQHGFEKWANFPHERKRFFALLEKYKINNLIILSGDRHIGTMAKTKLKNGTELYEVTASAINRPGNFNEKDPTYLGANIPDENYGVMTVDWEQKTVHLSLKNKNNETPLSTKIRFQ
ncbi:MAG: alkaline phosphatase D family protein [Bdellovibrionia bacterium]